MSTEQNLILLLLTLLFLLTIQYNIVLETPHPAWALVVMLQPFSKLMLYLAVYFTAQYRLDLGLAAAALLLSADRKIMLLTREK